MKKTEIFQLQKFYNSRHLWDDCFPEFVERYKITEKEMAELEGQPFSVRAKPRVELMNWFIKKIKNISNIEEVLSKLPMDEQIPVNGRDMSQSEFKKEFYGIMERTVSSKESISASTKIIEVPKIQKAEKNGKPIFKIIANFHAVGGGEMSSINICKMFIEKGYHVQFHPTQQINNQLKKRLPEEVEICESIMNGKVTGGSDVALIYANDFVYKFSKCEDNLRRILDNSKRNAICLNFVMGEAWQQKWRDRIHKYLFLNTTKENEVLNRWKEKKIEARPTLALAPPVFLDEYLKVKPDYSKITFVRTGRYGGKYDENDINHIIWEWRKIVPKSHFWFMATPPFLEKKHRHNEKFHLLNWDAMPIHEVLAQGSLYHYRLPSRMADQGPRIASESLAAGIPIIGENRDGMRDRLNENVGWFANTNEEFIDVVREIDGNIGLLKQKGEAAKEYAIKEFNPYRWVDEIIGKNE